MTEIDDKLLRLLRAQFERATLDLHVEHNPESLYDCTIEDCQERVSLLSQLDASIPMGEPKREGSIVTFGSSVALRTRTTQRSPSTPYYGIWRVASSDYDDDGGIEWSTILAMAARCGEIKVIREGWG